MNKLIIGSRGSNLALVQSEEVKAALLKANPDLEVEIEVISTKGDRILDRPLAQIGDKGLFTQEIEERLLNGTIDLAVHSMKDMPSVLPEGLMFTGTLPCSDERDCLVFNHGYKTLEDLPQGATVATGSLRRKVQLLKIRPDLNIVDIRGNVNTRLKKLKDNNYDALVLASAGLKRLNMEDLIGYYFNYDEMIPACCQGILALEVKENSPYLELIQQIVDQQSTRRMELERLFLKTVGSGCHSPTGGHITFKDDHIILDAIYGDESGNNLQVIHTKIDDNYEEEIIKIANQLKG